MKLFTQSLMSALFVLTAGYSSVASAILPDPDPVPTPEEFIMVRAAAEFQNITDDVRKAKLERSLLLLEQVLNTPIFRERVAAYTYKGKKNFVDNKSMDNTQVLKSLLDGSETLTPGVDNSVNILLTFYRKNNSTVGYTSPSTRLININLKFFDKYNEAEVAGNLVHEWTHKLGWNHASRHNSARPHSVPYAIGYMVRDIGEDLLGE